MRGHYTIMQFLYATALAVFIAVSAQPMIWAQDQPRVGSWVVLEKTDDGRYVGVLLSANEREVFLDSTAVGSVVVPRDLVRSIRVATTSSTSFG